MPLVFKSPKIAYNQRVTKETLKHTVLCYCPDFWAEFRRVRYWLRDDPFERVEAMLPGKQSDPGRSGTDSRLFVEAVLWIACTGSPW
jgi:hypothetical protein